MLPTTRELRAMTFRVWVIFMAAAACDLPATGWAESLPASVASCFSETDPGKRLSCYDREVARFMPRPVAKDAKPPVASADSRSGIAAATAKDAPVPSDAREQAAPHNAATPSHITSRIVAIEHLAETIVVHLDNGQVWQQAEEGPASPTLQVGDSVSIDRMLGSYWLSGRYGPAIQVRRKN